jgi:hypothetical protein
MTSVQLFAAIGVPMVFNGALIVFFNDSLNARLAGMEARLELLTVRVAELTDRLARVEQRLERR